MRYNNFHKHSHYSNIKAIPQKGYVSIEKPEGYIKRAIELGQTTYCTMETAFQGNVFEALTLCEQYKVKCIVGAEVIVEDNRLSNEEPNFYQIIFVAQNNIGRRALNKTISLANLKDQKAVVEYDMMSAELLDNCFIVFSCEQTESKEKQQSFAWTLELPWRRLFFEITCNSLTKETLQQNQIVKELHEKFGYDLIHGNNSYYVDTASKRYCNLFASAKNSKQFSQEDVYDYPDSDKIFSRYNMMGIFSDEDVETALKNTLVFDDCEPVDINKEYKLPKIVEGDSNLALKKIIAKSWAEKKKSIPKEDHKRYEEAIRYEWKIIEDCGMADYFILDYYITKKAVEEYGGILTRSGRGSAVSFLINHLLGLTEVDRMKAPITLYPTRFMSAERIILQRSLPDIDENWSSSTINAPIQASKDILGEDGIYYMVSYKPLQDASAFRLWCKANGFLLSEYDDVAKELEMYVNDKKWKGVIEESKHFRGVIESIAPSPCSFLLLDKPISEEVGLIQVKDITCCALDGYNCDVWKYLKNDYLSVLVWDLISKTYSLIGKPIDTIDTLLPKCDDKVWDLYAKGLTTTINQADSDYDKQILKRYKPRSLAELSAYVAGIRPGFASLLDNFVERKPYSTGVSTLDDLLEDSFHYLMYQESVMKFLVWCGIEEKKTYDIIKKIAKKKFKHKELEDLKSTLILGWEKQVGTTEGFSETWQVIEDSSRYLFNASHSLSVAIDSLYGAYLKSHYPLEYFTVALTMYSDDSTRTSNLCEELPYFSIKLKPIRFGHSRSDYVMDKKENAIYKGVSAVKYCNSTIAEELYELSKNNYSSFVELLDDIKEKTSVNSKQLSILIHLNYFKEFGKAKYLMEVVTLYDGIQGKLPSIRHCKTIKKDKIDSYADYGIGEFLIHKYAGKETAKTYSEIDNLGLLNELINGIPNEAYSIKETVRFEKEVLGYVEYVNPKIKDTYYIAIDYKTYKEKTRPYFVAYNLSNGSVVRTKIASSKTFKEKPFDEFSVLEIEAFAEKHKHKKINDEWVRTDETETVVEEYEVLSL